MKKYLLPVLVIIIGAAVFVWFLAPDSTTSDTTPKQPNTAQLAVASAQQGTAYIYDVRTPQEFDTKHVEGAINFDVEEIKAGSLPAVPKDSTIYVYCRSGNRSAQAAQLLKAGGFTNVTDLGGLDNLQEAGVI